MTDEITLQSPIDAHCHFRQGEMLRHVVPLTAATFAAAVVMPNTDPPIATPAAVESYRGEIACAGDERTPFRPYLTAYFGPELSRGRLEALRGNILAVKYYGRGLTTNSQHGCEPDDPCVDRILADMEELGITLCVHPEARGYYADREGLFGEIACRWAAQYPRLKIVLEHLSSFRSIELLTLENIYATVTPHHLLLTGDDWVGPPLRPHLYCMPVAKSPAHRDELVKLVTGTGDNPRWHRADKVMLGTDSAPHPVGRKEAAECCAGIFHAPIALQLVAGVFDGAGKLDRLQAFVSDNARRIHGMAPPEKAVRLVRRPCVVPSRYGDVVPMMAGETLDWSVAT